MKMILIILVMVSCGKNEVLGDLVKTKVTSDPRENLVSNEVFRAYIDTFKDNHYNHMNTEINVSDIPINFGELPSGIAGQCRVYYGKDTYKEVIISLSFWDIANDSEKQMLIDHEFGHCALNRVHLDDEYKSYNLSIMNSFIIDSNDYDQFKNEYNIELFTFNSNELKNSIDAL